MAIRHPLLLERGEDRNTKSQTPSSREFPNCKFQNLSQPRCLGAWELELLWSLEFGVWSHWPGLTMLLCKSRSTFTQLIRRPIYSVGRLPGALCNIPGMKFCARMAIGLAFFVGFLPGQTASPQLEILRAKRQGGTNIIFILADDLGYGDLGCYGQKRIKTPNIDRLAAEGMRFTQCYAGSTVCAPSRCCLITGVHTGHARIRGNARVPLEPADLTVAEILKPAGYQTAAIGKWGLGKEGTTGIPNKHGFDEWFGYLDQTHAHNYYPEFLWRNERQWQVPGNANGQKGDYSHDWFTRTSTNFIRINQKYPFFLYLAYTIPHANNELKDKGMEVPNDAPYSKED